MKIDKNITYSKARRVSGVHKLLKNALKAHIDKFDTRKALYREKTFFLKNDKDFTQDIEKIREILDIPINKNKKRVLDVTQDGVPYEINDQVELDSEWLSMSSDATKEKLKTSISYLMKKYKLPSTQSYKDWLWGCILYEINFDFAPKYNDLTTLLTTSVDNLSLTTREIEELKKWYRKQHNIRRRPPKEVAQDYKKFCELLSKHKNKRRRSRSIDTSTKTLRLGKKHSYYDFAVGKQISKKITSKDLATNIFSDDTGKKAALVRKQKQRLLERNKLRN